LIKKIIVVTVFLGGGYFLIKKLLPNKPLQKELQLEKKDINEVIKEEEKKEQIRKMNLQNNITNQYLWQMLSR